MRTKDGSGSSSINAVLRSPPLSPTGAMCVLEFYYYMNESTYTSITARSKIGSLISRMFWGNSRTDGKWVKQTMGIGVKPAGIIYFFFSFFKFVYMLRADSTLLSRSL